MPSKFFGNRFDKKSKENEKNSSQRSSSGKAQNQSNRSKAGGIRKVGRGGQSNKKALPYTN